MSLMNQNNIFLEISSHFSVCRPNSLHYHLQIHFIQHLQTEHIVLYSVFNHKMETEYTLIVTLQPMRVFVFTVYVNIEEEKIYTNSANYSKRTNVLVYLHCIHA